MFSHAQTNPNNFLPPKALSFAHPLEIHLRIILDTCRPDLYTKVHGNVDDNCLLYKLTLLSQQPASINLEVVYPQLVMKVRCMYNSPNLSIQATGRQREAYIYIPSCTHLCPVLITYDDTR